MTPWRYPRVFLADIISEAAVVFGVTEAAIKGKSRHSRNSRPRFACAYLGRRLTALSYPQLGQALGGRDHSTIINAVQQAEVFIGHDPEYRARVDAIRIRLLTPRWLRERQRREATARAAERVRIQIAEAEQVEQARVEAFVALDDMDQLSVLVSEFVQSGGSFVEARS